MSIDYINIEDITAIQFYTQYLAHNKPVLLHHINTTQLPVQHNFIKYNMLCNSTIQQYIHVEGNKLVSPSLTDSLHIITQSFDNRFHSQHVINTDYIQSTYTDELIDITVCHNILDKNNDDMTGDNKTTQITVQQYINEYKQCQSNNILYNYYWKDWHITQLSESVDAQWIVLPHISMNWLHQYYMNNTEYNQKQRDFRFCYIGPTGTYSTLHCDVYSSYSWSLNICGIKLWYIIEKQYIELCYDLHGVLCTSIFDIVKQPENYAHYNELHPYIITVIQRENELIYVPSNYYHSVHNLCDCISINENWCNGYNIQHINESMKLAYNEAYNECCKWNTMNDNTIVQSVMKSNHGMNYSEYHQFIVYTVQYEIQQYTQCAHQNNSAVMIEYHTMSLRKLRFILHELSNKLLLYSVDEITIMNQLFNTVGDILDSDNSNQRYKQIYKARQI